MNSSECNCKARRDTAICTTRDAAAPPATQQPIDAVYAAPVSQSAPIARNRAIYILLALFLGIFGVHNWVEAWSFPFEAPANRGHPAQEDAVLLKEF
ncbi:hypothetical protein B0X78_02450 [bacterium AM6]|nr:hypothetical protein B0X78_02450 [bacterium AM6]